MEALRRSAPLEPFTFLLEGRRKARGVWNFQPLIGHLLQTHQQARSFVKENVIIRTLASELSDNNRVSMYGMSLTA